MRTHDMEISMFKTKTGKYTFNEMQEDVVNEEMMTIEYTYEPREKQTYNYPGSPARVEVYALYDSEGNEVNYDLEELEEKYFDDILSFEGLEEDKSDTGDDDYHRIKEEFELDKEHHLQNFGHF